MNKNKSRPIDQVMAQMGLKLLKANDNPKMHEYCYKAIETEIKINNICRSRVKTTWDVTMFMSEDEWNFRFDKVGFEIKIRDEHRCQCKFVAANPYIQGIYYIKYTITILGKRR